MPTDLLFVWLHIEMNLSFVTIFSYIFCDAIMSCTMNILLSTLKRNESKIYDDDLMSVEPRYTLKI